MFPGCTLTDLRARQDDLLRQAGYAPDKLGRPGPEPRARPSRHTLAASPLQLAGQFLGYLAVVLTTLRV